jgi:hypothetical protein
MIGKVMKKFGIIIFAFLLFLPLSGQETGSKVIHFSGPSALQQFASGGNLSADSIMSHTYLILSSQANFDSRIVKEYDKILTYSHKVYIVKVQNITPSLVLFLYPCNTDLNSINRNEISQIQYADGSIDIFLPLTDKSEFSNEVVDTARIIIRNRRDWEKVTLTDKSEDISGMIEMGKISANFQADFVNAQNDYLEKNAVIILRKKAANLNAPVVLLVNKNFHKAYGDPPSVELEGILYSYE